MSSVPSPYQPVLGPSDVILIDESDTVLSIPLCAVEGPVGQLDELLRRLDFLVGDGDPCADTDRGLATADRVGIFPDSFSDFGCFFEIGGEGEDQSELLAPDTTADVRVPGVLSQRVCQGDEDAISFLVSMVIVDPLEVVHVQQYQRDAGVVSSMMPELDIQEFVEARVVVEASHPVAHREVRDLDRIGFRD